MSNEGITWPSAMVAIALIFLVAAVTVTAIIRYDVDSALEIWSSLGTVVGILTGAVVTYFFTRQTVAEAQRAAMETQRKADSERTRANDALEAFVLAAGHVDPGVWTSIVQAEPKIAAVLRNR